MLFKDQSFADSVLFGIIFLFFFQLLSDFIEAIYAFGLLQTGLPVEMVCVLLLFSPLFLLILRNGLSRNLVVILGEVMLLCRVVEVMLDTRGRMILAGIGVSCFMLLFPSFLRLHADEEHESGELNLGVGLTIGLALSILFRVLNSGIDISTYSWFQSIGWILAVIAGLLMVGISRREAESQSQHNSHSAENVRILNQTSSWKIFGPGLGIMAAFVLLYFTFTAPNVISRWAEANYLLIVSILMIVLGLFAGILTARKHLFSVLTPKFVLLWNGLFVLALVSTILIHQVKFPSESRAYPIWEPPVSLLHHIPLVCTLILFPIILIDFILFVKEIVAMRPTSRVLGGCFGLASFFLLLMIFAQIFTSVYDYIPVVGPFFRDKFWFVFLFGGIVLTLPVLLLQKNTFNFNSWLNKLHVSNYIPGIMLLISIAAIAGAFLTSSQSDSLKSGKRSLKLLTYNIQQGYDKFGIKNYNGQLDFIREINADVIGLQETDTNRISGGNSDVVRYFADKLNLFCYYGPKTVTGTFGIVLLSKYPIENPQTFYMYSEGEQTATIAAQITIGYRIFNIFVTHLGNGGPILQQQAILTTLEGMENVIAMGDFNFKPDTEQYQMTTEFLADSWLLRWPQGVDNQGLNPIDRIDYTFVSPGTKVADCRYLINTESDHPAMYSQIEW